MYTAFFIGNIASGKSFATRYLETRGARRIDLDEMAKGLYIPGSELVHSIAQEFGWDVLDEENGICRSRLAERAFASPESAMRLNALVHPVLLERLGTTLLPANCCSVMIPEFPLTVVEISAPAAFSEAFPLADEIVAVSAPVEVRRIRATARGMSAGDFDSRASCQPCEEELCALAATVIESTGTEAEFTGAVEAWLDARGIVLPNAEPSTRCSVPVGQLALGNEPVSTGGLDA